MEHSLGSPSSFTSLGRDQINFLKHEGKGVNAETFPSFKWKEYRGFY